MKKLPNTVMSTEKCLNCHKQLKQNLVNKVTNVGLCYKCFRVASGKPAEHVPRQKRIVASLPVSMPKS